MWETRVQIYELDELDKVHKWATAVEFSLWLEGELNAIGRDGWEPFHVIDDAESSGTTSNNDGVLVVWFKRYVVE